MGGKTNFTELPSPLKVYQSTKIGFKLNSSEEGIFFVQKVSIVVLFLHKKCGYSLEVLHQTWMSGKHCRDHDHMLCSMARWLIWVYTICLVLLVQIVSVDMVGQIQ